MLSPSSACRWLATLALLLAGSNPIFGQAAFNPQAGQYSLSGALNGDQLFSHAAIGATGGYVVWQDNATDGDGWGVSAQRLNNNLSGSLATFRVNEVGAGHQEKPQVVLLADGGAAFVWQGGPLSQTRIYARFMAANGIFVTGDVQVNTWTNHQQVTPAIARLSNGNVAVVWASFGQDGSMQGVYGQILSPVGVKIGSEFSVNQTTLYNQRTPSVAALANGNFAVGWISESSRGADPTATLSGSVGEIFGMDVYARIFTPLAVPVTGEFKVNTASKICANPVLGATSDGGFTVAWGQLSPEIKDRGISTEENGWDIFCRKFDGSGGALNAARRVNTYVYGDQYGPQIDSLGSDQLVVWTSLGQDGSREGVYGQFLAADGSLAGAEFLVNTTTRNQQMHPAVASDGASRFLVVWSSYVIGTQFDLFAQRYASAQALPQLPLPFVSALGQSKLSVSWAALAGYDVAAYSVYVDGSATPITTTNNYVVVSGLAAGSSHTFRMDYLLTDGRRSGASPTATASTWGEDANFDGLPDDWQARYFGNDPANWPAANVDSDGDGATNLQEFLAGTDPTDSSSVLKTALAKTPQGLWLNWNTQPGFIYQVQASPNFVTWTNLGGNRFAAGTTDSMAVTPAGPTVYYRIIRVR